MNDVSPSEFIEIPPAPKRPVKIDAVLAQRMQEFLLMRRQKLWREEGI